MKHPQGQGLLIAYVDFDGVLHHEAVYRKQNVGPTLRAPRQYKLFQHADLLDELFAPFPSVKIVLSTSWCVYYGFIKTAQKLPPGLRDRCIGATYHSRIPRGDWFATSRGEQVSNDARRRRPRAWFALDDDAEDWPAATRRHLVLTDPYEGLSPAAVQEAITNKLRTLSRAETTREARLASKAILAEAIAGGQRQMGEWTVDGTLLSAEQFAERAGVSVAELANAVSTGELFALSVDGRRRYVAALLALDAAGRASLCRALGPLDGAQKLVFMLRKHGSLAGMSVTEAARHGRVARVVALAKAWVLERTGGQ